MYDHKIRTIFFGQCLHHLRHCKFYIREKLFIIRCEKIILEWLIPVSRMMKMTFKLFTTTNIDFNRDFKG